MKELLIMPISGCFYKINEQISSDAQNLFNIRWSFCMMNWTNSYILFSTLWFSKSKNKQYKSMRNQGIWIVIGVGVGTGTGAKARTES